MNKEQFMMKLRFELLPLPEKERYEILEEYDAHFEFGKQQGRTEEEIAKELGVPEELAAELLDSGNNEQRVPRFGGHQTHFGSYQQRDMQYAPPYDAPVQEPYQDQGKGQFNYGQPPYPSYELRQERSSKLGALLTIVGTAFVGIIVFPLMISGWAVCIALAVVAITLLALPLIYMFRLAVGGPFYGGEMSLVVIAFGIGLFLAQFVIWLMKAYMGVSNSYVKWTVNSIRRGS